MDELLPFYERELSLLRTHSKEFARAYPKIAGRLQLSGDVAEDPHVERMIESFALLAARVHKRLDDDFPLFTETFLDVLYPHYLRPFPSCSVAQFDLGSQAAQMSQSGHVPRGTVLASKQVRGVACKFRTAYATDLLPLRISQLRFRSAVVAPEGTRLPAGATSMLSIQLDLTSAQMSFATLGVAALRCYLDGEASQVSVLREALTQRVVGACLQLAPTGPWQASQACAIRVAGFEADAALIDHDARSHPAYRLLTEYFAFPDKFNFIDIELPAALRAERHARSATLHLMLSGVRSDSVDAQLLETLSARQLVLGCTPVVNLFRQAADPVRVTHQAPTYPVLTDARRAYAYEIVSVERVTRVKQSPSGDTVEDFRPFYSLRHDELTEAGGRYWYLQRDEALAALSPGHETRIAIVDLDFEPASPQTETLSIEVCATNRDLPSQLAFGTPGGDLFLEGGSLAREIRLLRKPTASQRFERGRGALWRLISHLSLNHLSLQAGGIDALKEMLRLYDLPRSAVNRQQVDGIHAIAYTPKAAWLPGKPFATFVRGIEVRLTLDEANFVGTGVGIFAEVLDHFFGMYVHVNSFTQLVVLSHATGEVIWRGAPRNGDSALA